MAIDATRVIMIGVINLIELYKSVLLNSNWQLHNIIAIIKDVRKNGLGLVNLFMYESFATSTTKNASLIAPPNSTGAAIARADILLLFNIHKNRTIRFIVSSRDLHI